MATRRVAIIEDHGALRVFLRDVLTRLEWEVTGTAGTADAAYELVVGSTPDVAIVDLHLGSAGGGDALVRRLAEADTNTRLLVFTATSDPRELRDVLEAGADGIVLKEGGLPELMSALDAVLAGRRYVSPQLASDL
jgi:two-component system, NarL family, invasion response regulator UvrY